MKIRKIKFFPALLITLISCVSDQNNGNWNPGIDKIVLEALNTEKVAGISVGISFRGKEFYKGYGKANLEFDVPTPNDAIYEIGSVTKQFTAAAI